MIKVVRLIDTQGKEPLSPSPAYLLLREDGSHVCYVTGETLDMMVTKYLEDHPEGRA